jgi:alpha-ketoglutarate-dependent taurine dioxygenase
MSANTESTTAVPAPSIVRPETLGSSLKVEPVAPALGAEISNLGLANAVEDDDLFAEIRELLLKHKVLFFRDQDILPATLVAFARRFGDLETHPIVPSHPDHPELLLLNRDTKHSYENTWHCDATWRAEPPMGAVLRCVVCPNVGGDTMWANMALAYERLPDHVKTRIEGLRAKHSIEHSFGGSMTPKDRAKLSTTYPMVEHPVVRSHPETGEKVLFVNQGFTTHFVNFHNHEDVRFGQDFTIEANNLLNYLVRQAEIPEYQVRLRWRPNTIAIWDNRATQHYAIHDFYPAERRMMRATIVGDQPY